MKLAGITLVALIGVTAFAREGQFDQLKAKAEQGDVESQVRLATRYQIGYGVSENESEASKWFSTAWTENWKEAQQGNVIAERRLGSWFRRGIVIPQDYTKAREWFLKAAEQGDADSMSNLGEMYSLGQGGPIDPIVSEKWSKSAFVLFQEKAANGDAQSMFSLSRLYAEGKGVVKDAADSLKWLRMAGENGLLAAQKDLAVLYLNGKNRIGNTVPIDKTEGIKWMRKGADALRADAEDGDPVDQTNYASALAEIAKIEYHDAEQFRQAWDNVEAALWNLKAAKQGYSQAQFHLANVYDSGIGVEKNAVEGMAWAIASVACAQNEDLKADHTEIVNLDEITYGPEKTRLAKLRSKEILAEIAAAKGNETIPQLPAGVLPSSPKASGSGALVSAEGYILTAAHVVSGASKIQVLTASGTLDASIIKIDESNDSAVLKIAGGPYFPLPIAPSRKVRLGQVVATIGFPNIQIQGFSPKVTRGEISSLNGIGDDPRGWQISVPVQPGNSGGPLLDENGNLIGIVVSKLGRKAVEATGDIPQNVNYAVKSAYALALLEPYLDSNAPEPNLPNSKPSFEDMVAKAQQSVVLILVY